MEEAPPFPPNIQVNSLKDYLLVTGNTYNIVTKVNGKLRMKLQTILDRCISSNRQHGVGKSDLK